MSDDPEIDMLDLYYHRQSGTFRVSVVADGKMRIYRISREKMFRALASGYVAAAEGERGNAG